jgi:hypothetical protein
VQLPTHLPLRPPPRGSHSCRPCSASGRRRQPGRRAKARRGGARGSGAAGSHAAATAAAGLCRAAAGAAGPAGLPCRAPRLPLCNARRPVDTERRPGRRRPRVFRRQGRPLTAMALSWSRKASISACVTPSLKLQRVMWSVAMSPCTRAGGRTREAGAVAREAAMRGLRARDLVGGDGEPREGGTRGKCGARPACHRPRRSIVALEVAA